MNSYHNSNSISLDDLPAEILDQVYATKDKQKKEQYNEISDKPPQNYIEINEEYYSDNDYNYHYSESVSDEYYVVVDPTNPIDVCKECILSEIEKILNKEQKYFFFDAIEYEFGSIERLCTLINNEQIMQYEVENILRHILVQVFDNLGYYHNDDYGDYSYSYERYEDRYGKEFYGDDDSYRLVPSIKVDKIVYDIIECIFKNQSIKTETLTVIKNIGCDLNEEICEQNTIKPSDFKIIIEGNKPSQSIFYGSSSGTDIRLGEGPFSISEVGLEDQIPPVCDNMGFDAGRNASDIGENLFICTNFSEGCEGSITLGVSPLNCEIENVLLENIDDNNIYNSWSDDTSGNNEILFVKSTDGGDTFSEPKNISNNQGESINPVIAVSGNIVYVVWNDDTSNNNEILFVKSTDGGDTFSEPKNISNNQGESINPVIAVSGNIVYVVWNDDTSNNNEILFVKSTNGGDNFTTPKNISNNSGNSENPAIAVSNDIIYVVWNDDSSSNNEILLSTSTNGGDNFTTPKNISNNSGNSENPAIAVSGDTVYIVWSNSASNSEIFFIKSTDAGENFDNPENISNNEGTSENPVIVVVGDTVYVVWIDNTSSNNEVPIAVSENGGENFSEPQTISNGGDPSDPQITISGDEVSITWIDNASGSNKIVIAESDDGGDTFNAPKTVSNNPNVYVTWSEDDGNIAFQRDVFIGISNDNGTSFSKHLLNFVSPNGTLSAGGISDPSVFGTNIYATWIGPEDILEEGSDAFIAVSNDNGTSFDTQRLSIVDLNGSASASRISDPIVSENNVYVTWREDENPSTFKEDTFIAISNDNGQTFDTISLSLVDSNGPTDVDTINKPVVSGENVFVTWTEDENTNTGDEDAFIAVSDNNGISFTTTRLSLSDPNGTTSADDISEPAIFGSNVYVSWLEGEDANEGGDDAFIAVSNNNGTSFTTTRLSLSDPNGTTSASDIKMPVLSGDNVYVTWREDENTNTGDEDLFIAVSNDNGQTFETTRLSIADPTGSTRISGTSNLNIIPVVSGDNVYVTWSEEEEHNADDNDIFIAVSNDNGQTFNTIKLSSPHPGFSTTLRYINNPVSSGDNVYVTWIEDNNFTQSDEEAFIAISNDNGQTFKNTILSITDPEESAVEDNFISLPVISGNNIYVTYQENPADSPDSSAIPFIAVSNDNGQTFNSTSLSIADRDGSRTDHEVSSPIVSGNNVYVTWGEEDDIIGGDDAYIAVSNDNGQTFNTTNLSIPGLGPTGGGGPTEPVVSGNNVYGTWSEQRGNNSTAVDNIFIAVSNDNGQTFDTQGLSIFNNTSLANIRSVGNPVVP